MGGNLDRFVRSTITRSTRTVSRRGFGIAMLVGFHTAFLDRVREYEAADDLLDDLVAGGYSASEAAKHPLYLAARRLKAQSPSPPRFKVGRRAGAPDQVLRLTPSTPVEDEVFWITVDGVTFSVTAGNGDTAEDVLDALVALINPDPDAIIQTIGSTAGTQILDDTDLDGAVGGGDISPPRNLTFTHNGHADWDATTGIVTGLDPQGRTITEEFSIPNGAGAGAQSVTLSKIFAKVISLAIPAQTGTNGTATLGVGKKFDAESHLKLTATDGATYVDLAADDSGDWYALEASSNFAIEDRTAEPTTTLAEDLAAIMAADADFYGLAVVDAQSAEQIEAIAEWVETQALIYVPHTADTAVTEDVTTDVATALVEAEFLRTKPFWSRRNHGRFPDAAILGRMLPFTIGSAHWEYKSLTGILPDDLSSTELTRLTGTPESPLASKRCLVYIAPRPTGTNVGTPITYGGLAAGGEWIDNIQGFDLTNARLQEVAFNLQISSPKIPYTSAGIDAFKGAVENVLAALASAPHNLYDPSSIVVEATALEDTSAEDRAARYYDGIRWGARLQGAIRFAGFGGNVTA